MTYDLCFSFSHIMFPIHYAPIFPLFQIHMCGAHFYSLIVLLDTFLLTTHSLSDSFVISLTLSLCLPYLDIVSYFVRYLYF